MVRGKNKILTNTKDLTQKELKKQLRYFPKTGIFKWKINKNGVKKGTCAGCLDKSVGYIVIGINYKLYFAHRLAFLYMKGKFPKYLIDHEDQNKTNNKWNNLRKGNHVTNSINSKIRKTNKSGITGVHWCVKNKKWVAQITHKRKAYNLGIFSSKTKAVQSRYKAEQKYNFNKIIKTTSFIFLKKRNLI